MNKQIKRCKWAFNSKLYLKHHDNFWGNICKNENELFKMLILESQHAGLSFAIVLSKIKGYEKYFDFKNIEKIANLSNEYLDDVLNSNEIIRNKLKIYSIRDAAIAYLNLKKDYKSLYDFLWSHTNYEQLRNEKIVNRTQLSDLISKKLKKYGFKFLGSITIFSFLQSVGIYDDHERECFKFNQKWLSDN